MTVELFVGGRIFEGWESIEVSRGLDRSAGSFALRVSDRPWGIRPGAPCSVALDGEKVLTGYVDTVAPSFDAKSHSLAVNGRSRVADLVDNSAEFAGGQFSGMTLGQIAAALAKPFGITVRSDQPAIASGAGAPFETVKLNPGETVFEVLEKLARHLSLVLTDNAQGDLVITAAARARADTALVESAAAGGNILAARGRFSVSGRHSSYRVLGQRKGLDSLTEKQAAQVEGIARDPGVAELRHRPLVLQSATPLTPGLAGRLARHEAAVRYGRAAAVEVTLRGWRQGANGTAGRLWVPNEIARLEAPRLALARDMLIVAVTYSMGKGGMQTHLSLARPEAYDPAPPAAIDAAGDPWAALRKDIADG